ncbi:hypothetical protein [Pseudomonas agarici]|uniref:hypothetical protein n=1 Tax=Pseudomonas agarici TaxID=46677 RepID=UPI0009E8A916|nr:hypothetical protein [Pseudomonas agarici]
MLNSVSGSAGAFGRVGTVIPSASTSGASDSPRTLKEVIEKLADALMAGGHLSTDSPLGKMIEQQLKKNNSLMELTGNNDVDAVKKALGEVIQDKLGGKAGAAADASMAVGQGGLDLLSQVMHGLSKAILNHALTDKGDGSTFASADKPILQQIADYMDKNKAVFGAPNSGSWSKELDEDNYLDKGETAKFKAALEQVSQLFGAGDAPAHQANAGGLGSLAPASIGGDANNALGDVKEQLANLWGAKSPVDIFKQGLEMGLGLASGLQSGALAHQLQQHDLRNSAAEAAQNILDVMTSNLA